MTGRHGSTRRTLLTTAASCAAAALVEISGVHKGAAQSSMAVARPSTEAGIWSKEYWAKKGDVSLYMFRKRMGDAAADRETRPVLFLAHGSSVSSRPTFDLAVPGHDDYSLMDTFARYGFDVWTMDFEGYGHSSQGPGNSDIATGAEDLKAAFEKHETETEEHVVRLERVFEEIDEPRQEEAKRCAAREQRQRTLLGGRQSALAAIGTEQRASLGDIEGMIRLETPGV